MNKLNNKINITERIKLGGIDQWISIQGSDESKPILLLLHGGPGEPISSSIIRRFLPELENLFVVVNWHQRGAGKSFSRKVSVQSMTVEQLVSDTVELTKILLTRFNRKKLVLLGGSWGSFLGISTILKNPELYYAYIGTGQIVYQEEGEKISYDFVMKKAKEVDDKKGIKILKKIGRPPCPKEKHLKYLLKQRRLIRKHKGSIYSENSLRKIARYSQKGYNFFDKINFLRGHIFSEKNLGLKFRKINFLKTANKLKVPVFFLLGKHDWQTPTVLAKKYYDILEAPKKELYIFDKSGHLPPFEEPDKFIKIIKERVLLICDSK